MKSLQTYILENIDQDINEGELWDSIKEWFKKLFEPTDKKFDRYNPDSDINGIILDEYIQYLDEHFDKKYLKLKKLTKEDLKKIVYPNGKEPNEEDQIGFYKFIDDVNKKDDKSLYFGFIYDEKNIKDTSCLINIIYKDNKIEILNIQILKEFNKYLPLKKIISLLIKNETFIKNCSAIFIKETTDKEVYKQLINDSEFEKEFDKKNNTNIATKNL